VVSGANVAAGHSTNRLAGKVARVASQPDVNLIVDPETTNMKLVAR
jgi:hypothetical protein